MEDYRDDTLSWDKYQVQEDEPVKVQGVPESKDVYIYQLVFHDNILADIAAETASLAPVLTVHHIEGTNRVAMLAIGSEAMLAEVLAWGYVARGFTSDARWRNVTARGPYNTISVE